ncbi:MAG: hypothetical protein ACPIOQ_27665, partial [Promethearchaeia archaeon]
MQSASPNSAKPSHREVDDRPPRRAPPRTGTQPALRPLTSPASLPHATSKHRHAKRALSPSPRATLEPV